MKFGTDGVRGPAGVFPIDVRGAARMGAAVAQCGQRVVVARDTRLSGPELIRALVDAARAGGAHVQDVGLLPTPGVSALLAAGWADLGVMITASHNGPADNGLKVLSGTGGKLSDGEQARIEALLAHDAPPCAPDHTPVERVSIAESAYISAVLQAGRLKGALAGTSIVVDAANGAASHTLPGIFEGVAVSTTRLACAGEGFRINVECGALHPAALVEQVLATGAQAGVAVDGDGDRCTLVSASGRVLDGDAQLYLLAQAPAVVGTVMSNAGLEAALAAKGIALVRTSVGDRYVEAAMHERGLSVGGEPSGHVVFADGLPSADGTLTALRVLAGGVDLDARLDGYIPFPSTLINVPVSSKPPIETVPALVHARQEAVAALAPHGRVVFRYSGTEPVLRVMAEGPDEGGVEEVARRLAERVRAVLGEGG